MHTHSLAGSRSRRKILWFLSVALTAAAVLPSASGQEVVESSAPEITTPILPGVSEAALGGWFDVNLAPIGTRAFPATSVVVDPSPTDTSPQWDAGYQRLSTTDAVLARATFAWFSASGGIDSSSSQAVFRATQTTRVARIDPSLLRTMPTAPREARFVLTEIHSGRMAEYHFQGSEETLRAGVGAIYPGGHASIDATQTTSGVEIEFASRGLRPRDGGSSVFASPADAETAFVSDTATPVPILARFTPVNTDRAVRVRVQSVTFSSTRIWDPGNGPEIVVHVWYGSVELARLRGDENTWDWPVPVANGTLILPVQPSTPRPLRFVFEDEDMLSNDAAGSIEITGLAAMGTPQCFPSDPSQRAHLPDVTFCLVVQDAE